MADPSFFYAKTGKVTFMVTNGLASIPARVFHQCVRIDDRRVTSSEPAKTAGAIVS